MQQRRARPATVPQATTIRNNDSSANRALDIDQRDLITEMDQLLDLNAPENGLYTSFAELKQHLREFGQRWLKSTNTSTSTNTEIKSYQQRSRSHRVELKTNTDIDFLLSAGAKRIRARQNSGGYWNSAYIGGPLHASMRLITLHYLEANEEPEIVHAAMLDLMSGQSETGGFQIYPDGPCSKAVTRMVYLALVCAMQANNGAVTHDTDFLLEVRAVLQNARRFIESNEESTEWILYTVLADLHWRLVAPALPQTFPELPTASSWFYLLLRGGALGPFQSVMQALMPAMLILFRAHVETGFWRGILKLEKRFLRRLENNIIASQDGDGAWVETVVATCLCAMALKRQGYSNDHPCLAKAIQFLSISASVNPHGIMSVNWACGDMWDTALHADVLQLLDSTDKEKLANQLVPHLLLGLRPDARWSFSMLGRVTDNDSSSVALLALSHCYPHCRTEYKSLLNRIIDDACTALMSHQLRDGGWATFDDSGLRLRSHRKPGPERGALFDFSSPDVTARVVTALLAAKRAGPISASTNNRIDTAIAKGLDYLGDAQTMQGPARGCYWSRWLLGPIAGTCFSVIALRAAGVPVTDRRLALARRFILRMQNSTNGGWGEDARSDQDLSHCGDAEATPLQTSLAIMSLIACADSKDDEAKKAIQTGVHFIRHQHMDGCWQETKPMGTILIGLDYFITPENTDVAILASLKVYQIYSEKGAEAAIDYWVTRRDA